MNQIKDWKMKFDGSSGSNYRCDLINRYRESRWAFFVSSTQEKHWFCAKGRAVHMSEKTSESLAGHEVVKGGKSRPVEKSYNDRIALGGCYREWRPRARIFFPVSLMRFCICLTSNGSLNPTTFNRWFYQIH